MTRRIVLALLAAGLASACRGRMALAPGERGEVVESEGWAPVDPADPPGTRQRALADAQRKAVERVVGVYISAKSRVSQAVEVDQNILADVGGYVRKYDVLSEGEEGGFHRTRIRALVLYEKVGRDLQKAGLLRPPAPPGNPKVVVLLDEGRASQGVRRGLLERGFQVVESTAAADLVVKGKGDARRLEDSRLGGFFSFRARVSLEALKPASGEVVSSKVQEASAIDPSLDIAQAKSLDSAGFAAGTGLAGELALLLGSRSAITLRVRGLPGLEETRRLAEDIRLQPEVVSATLSGFDRKLGAEFSVLAEKMAGDELAAALLRMRKHRFTIDSVSPFLVEASLGP